MFNFLNIFKRKKKPVVPVQVIGWDKADVERLRAITENNFNPTRTDLPYGAWADGVKEALAHDAYYKQRVILEGRMAAQHEATRLRKGNPRPVVRYIQKPGHNKTPFTFSGDDDNWVPYKESSDSGTN